jgi:hypothetical protein
MKVVLGGIIKNIESCIPILMKFLTDLKEVIPVLEVCLYENNSTDSTKAFLQIIKKKFDWIEIVSEDFENAFFLNEGFARTWDNKPCRIEMIAYARNQLLKMIESKNLVREDFFILMDLDIKICPDVNALKHILNQMPEKVDVLFANGIRGDGRYYDGYELRTEEYPFGPEILGEEFWSEEHMGKILKEYDSEGSFTPVISAFGGIAIYKGDTFKGCSYSANVTDELHEFYSKRVLPDSNKNPVTHHEGVLLGCYLKDDKIFYRNNSGYNYPICAEHVNFHLMIRKKGFTNMFICPFLYYYWL